ncbi:MAG: regulatory protein RecX [Firmicutes bacterium]|nr:regulatory protein RecX [Bacillota bacterium]
MEKADKAKNQAVHFLTFRPRSCWEIRQYLKRKGHPPAVRDEVVEWLKRLGYVDDLRFAKQWIESRTRTNPMGTRRLAQELWQKGIPRFLIDEALADFEKSTDEGALAAELAKQRIRRYPHESSEVITRRLAGFLGRRGFKSEDIHSAIKTALEAFRLP